MGNIRRVSPRVPALGGFCTEISDEGEVYSILSDVSPTGLRLHRPHHGDQSRVVQLEFDLPGIDELIWAKALVCFARVWESHEGRVLQTTGVELIGAASKHMRLLREYAFDRSPRFGHYAERRAASR
jgi:hypothetical protein